jgi:5-deoxy-D-glucuronate isomerase
LYQSYVIINFSLSETNKVAETLLSKKKNYNSIGKNSTSRLPFNSQENIDPTVELPDRNAFVVPKTFPSLGQVEAYSNYYLQFIDKLILITPLICVF